MKQARLITALIFFHVSTFAPGQTWYVSVTGSDSNSGTLQSPFKTIEKAVSVVQPGQTIYVRGGIYSLTTTINISKNGTVGAVISLFAYTGERPILNFSAQALDGANRGIRLTGSYWHIRGIDITGAGDNGMKIETGHDNTIENCAFYRNRDSGLQIDNGAADNRILNCDSYFNADPVDFGDADGFAPKMNVGTGNYFFGCRSWRNCDDGWDGYLRGTDDPSTTLENCWSFENGYFEDGSDAGVNANGNGFKMGGSDDKTLKHNFTLKNCLAFKNKAKGFDQNNNKGSMTLYNCTGTGNMVDDYRITQALAEGKLLIIKNCIAFGTASIGSFAQQEKNSWLSPFVVTAGDFMNTDPTGVTGPRKADGSLPDITFMHLEAGSDLIDAGVNVGLPFFGMAPDLGCFERGLTATEYAVADLSVLLYPNPVSENAILHLTTGVTGRCRIMLFDVTGKHIKTLADRNTEPGEHNITLNLSDIRDGIYFYRVIINDMPVATGKLIKTASENK